MNILLHLQLNLYHTIWFGNEYLFYTFSWTFIIPSGLVINTLLHLQLNLYHTIWFGKEYFSTPSAEPLPYHLVWQWILFYTFSWTFIIPSSLAMNTLLRLQRNLYHTIWFGNEYASTPSAEPLSYHLVWHGHWYRSKYIMNRRNMAMSLSSIVYCSILINMKRLL